MKSLSYALRALIGFGLLAPVVGCATPLTQAIHDLGFADMRPPSTIYAPGTILREKDGEIGIVCTQKAALGPDVPLAESATITKDELDKLTGSFDLKGGYLEYINGSLSAKVVSAAHLTLSNTMVFEMADTTVTERVGLASPACKQAIETRLNAKYNLSMVFAVLKADVEYTLDFNAGTELALQATITEEFAAKFDAKVSAENKTVLKGTGLFWGLKSDPDLVSMFKPVPVPRAAGQALINVLPIGNFQVAWDAAKKRPTIDAE